VAQCACIFLALSQSDAELYDLGVRLCECPDGQVLVLCRSCREWGGCWEIDERGVSMDARPLELTVPTYDEEAP
jgi:hypothetical protein